MGFTLFRQKSGGHISYAVPSLRKVGGGGGGGGGAAGGGGGGSIRKWLPRLFSFIAALLEGDTLLVCLDVSLISSRYNIERRKAYKHPFKRHKYIQNLVESRGKLLRCINQFKLHNFCS